MAAAQNFGPAKINGIAMDMPSQMLAGSLSHFAITFQNASNAAVNQNDVLSIAAQSINKNGGTVVDTVGGGNAEMAVSSAVASAAGTITVGA